MHHVTSGMSHTVMPKQQSALELRHRVGHMVGFYAANGCYVQPTRRDVPTSHEYASGHIRMK